MALDLDGVDDKVDHGDIAAIDGVANFTIMFDINWAAQEATASWTSKIVATSGADGFDTQEAATNAIRWMIGSGGWNTYGTSGNILVAGWQHMAFFFDGAGAANADRAKVYRNAVNQALSFTGSIPATIGANTQPLLIGGGGREGAFADAVFANVKAWTASLTLAEIYQEMQTIRPQRTTNLILWSPYLDGTSARDYSGAGNHGTVTGALQAAGPPVSYGGFSKLVGPVLLGAMLASGRPLSRREFLRQAATVPLIGRS